MIVFDSTHLVHTGVSSITEFFDDLKVNEASRMPLVLHLIWVAEALWPALFLRGWRNVQSLSDKLCCGLLAICIWVYILEVSSCHYYFVTTSWPLGCQLLWIWIGITKQGFVWLDICTCLRRFDWLLLVEDGLARFGDLLRMCLYLWHWLLQICWQVDLVWLHLVN